MISKRLETIASLVDKDSYVIDIGTDHSYIPIFLVKNNITKNVLATDISKYALEQAKNNIKRHALDIPVILSDGFKNTKGHFDIAIIAGMGAHTIIDIVSSNKIPEKLIIESNNNVDLVRSHFNKIGYKILKEVVVFENNKYYNIIKFGKGNETLTNEEILFGKSNNKKYFQYLYEKYYDLYKKSNNEKYKEYCNTLKLIIEKIPDDFD